MAQIKLIVTGDMEKAALVEPLKKLFPSERHIANNRSEAVNWAKPRKLHGATSYRLSALSRDKPPGTQMAAVMPALRHQTDVEQFECVDPLWLPFCRDENQQRQIRNPWWRHELHPKAYLEHLTMRQRIEYEETNHGKAALAALDWRNVLKVQGDSPIICALLEDIADWFGCINPVMGRCEPDQYFYPIKTVNRGALLLRNM
jgi:hypothetical protein